MCYRACICNSEAVLRSFTLGIFFKIGCGGYHWWAVDHSWRCTWRRIQFILDSLNRQRKIHYWSPVWDKERRNSWNYSLQMIMSILLSRGSDSSPFSFTLPLPPFMVYFMNLLPAISCAFFSFLCIELRMECYRDRWNHGPRPDSFFILVILGSLWSLEDLGDHGKWKSKFVLI